MRDLKPGAPDYLFPVKEDIYIHHPILKAVFSHPAQLPFNLQGPEYQFPGRKGGSYYGHQIIKPVGGGKSYWLGEIDRRDRSGEDARSGP